VSLPPGAPGPTLVGSEWLRARAERRLALRLLSRRPEDKRGTNSKKAITLIAALVAVLAVTSGAFAAKQYLIVSSKQIKRGAIALSDLSHHARKVLHGQKGATGPAGKDGTNGTNGLPGPRGPKGDKGDPGAPGDSQLAGAYYSVAYYDVGNTNGGAIATVACKAQTDTPISGGVSTDDYTKSVPVGQSFPGRMNWDTNTPKPNRLDGWIVQFASQNGSAPEKVKVWALCVPGLNVPVDQTFTQSIDG
jgi:Collagen triple helix repeat (20 copies)